MTSPEAGARCDIQAMLLSESCVSCDVIVALAVASLSSSLKRSRDESDWFESLRARLPPDPPNDGDNCEAVAVTSALCDVTSLSTFGGGLVLARISFILFRVSATRRLKWSLWCLPEKTKQQKHQRSVMSKGLQIIKLTPPLPLSTLTVVFLCAFNVFRFVVLLHDDCVTRSLMTSLLLL